ncbi:MAG TPA: hypothetical protein VF748_07560 [Candidatus Acidoferrum sp.]
MKRYWMLFLVEAEHFGAFIQHGGPYGMLLDFKETPSKLAAMGAATEPATPPTVESKPSRYANGKRDKGIGSDALVLLTLEQPPLRPWTRVELEDVFEAHEFARESASPPCSRLTTKGHIRKLAEGVWASKNYKQPDNPF